MRMRGICVHMRTILHTHANEILMPFITQKTQPKTLMKQLDIVVSPPAFLWDPYLTLTDLDLWPWYLWPLTCRLSQTDRRTDRRKAAHKSPQCMSTGGLKNYILTGWPWPMTLTIELVQDIIKVNLCTKFYDHMPNGSAVRALTDRHTPRHTETQTAPFL